MITIDEMEQQIINEFQQLSTIDEKYFHLFELGDSLPTMEAGLKTLTNLVEGCQSTLWFHINSRDGFLYLEADSDSMVIKGISALVARLVEGHEPAEVLRVNFDFLDKIGLWKMASQSNPGLNAMLKHLHQHASAAIE